MSASSKSASNAGQRPGLFKRFRSEWRRMRLDPGMPYADVPFKPTRRQ